MLRQRKQSKFKRGLLVMGTLFLSLSLLGCGYMGYKRAKWAAWDKTDQILYGTTVLVTYTDYKSTIDGLDAGLRELNPILGEHPSDTTLALFSVGVALGAYYMAQYMSPADRKFFLGGLTFLKGAASVNNWMRVND